MIKWFSGATNMPHLYFETSAVLITLILFGKYLEARAKSQTTNALSELLNLQAKEARLIDDNGMEKMVPLNQVNVDDILLIKPGEKIPVDGQIIKGETAIDESMLTGESMPVDKHVDDVVIGSTMNTNGVITIMATKVGKDTALSNIIKVVEEAQSSKAPIQRLADIISGYFVPIVIAIALLTFLIWITLVHPGQFEDAPSVLVMSMCTWFSYTNFNNGWNWLKMVFCLKVANMSNVHIKLIQLCLTRQEHLHTANQK